MTSFEVPHQFQSNHASNPGDVRCRACGQEPAHAFHAEVPEQVRQTMMAQVVQVPPAPAMADLRPDFVGDSPFWLAHQPPGGAPVGIDVDTPGWIADNIDRMRSPGTWFLMHRRTGRPMFSVLLREGDQFYFAKRHIGNLMAAREVLCYGIGKKQADGQKVNLWLMPNGVVCGGDDVDVLAARMIG